MQRSQPTNPVHTRAVQAAQYTHHHINFNFIQNSTRSGELSTVRIARRVNVNGPPLPLPQPLTSVQPTASVRPPKRENTQSPHPISPPSLSASRDTSPASDSTPESSKPRHACAAPPASREELLSRTTKSHSRKQPANHVPRPRNAFILYRSHIVRQGVVQQTEKDHREISKIVAELWHNMGAEDKAVWKQAAEQEKIDHKRLYPDYRYTPVYKNATAAAAKRKAKEPNSEQTRSKVIAKLMMEGETGDTIKNKVHMFDLEQDLYGGVYAERDATPSSSTAPPLPLAVAPAQLPYNRRRSLSEPPAAPSHLTANRVQYQNLPRSRSPPNALRALAQKARFGHSSSTVSSRASSPLRKPIASPSNVDPSGQLQRIPFPFSNTDPFGAAKSTGLFRSPQTPYPQLAGRLDPACMPYDMPMPGAYPLPDISSTLFTASEDTHPISPLHTSSDAPRTPQWAEFFNTPDPAEGGSAFASESELSSRPSTPVMHGGGGSTIDISPVPSLSHTQSTQPSPMGTAPTSPRRRSLSQGPHYPSPAWNVDALGIAKRPSMDFIRWEGGRRQALFGWEDRVDDALYQMEDDD